MSYGERVFFNKGDIVRLKKDITGRPDKMMVYSADKMKYKTEQAMTLLGITCIWFTTDGTLQKFRFDSKDLMHIK